ncbi:hypothetical protein HY450_01515 [Candidatus Pacearchaeota archaeon]|nr:hypothetical protein [Candidatus Pacearchaeota archaeon]
MVHYIGKSGLDVKLLNEEDNNKEGIVVGRAIIKDASTCSEDGMEEDGFIEKELLDIPSLQRDVEEKLSSLGISNKVKIYFITSQRY